MSLTGNANASEILKGRINWLKTIHGYSAYEIAVINGFRGTQEEWLETLNGLTAYEVAVKNGYEGTEADWLASLKGDKGDKGDMPVVGVDYFTEDDKTQMVCDILAALPKAEEESY